MWEFRLKYSQFERLELKEKLSEIGNIWCVLTKESLHVYKRGEIEEPSRESLESQWLFFKKKNHNICLRCKLYNNPIIFSFYCKSLLKKCILQCNGIQAKLLEFWTLYHLRFLNVDDLPKTERVFKQIFRTKQTEIWDISSPEFFHWNQSSGNISVRKFNLLLD